jgi:YHS domain-containing protein
MKSKTIFLTSLLGMLLVWGQETLRKTHFNLENGLAVQGYDVVAYFKVSKALKGSKEFSLVYNGIRYQFASAENKETFKKAPSNYEPEFGGWCAYAMGSSGEKVEVDPETFKIVNGKLYLFYNQYFNNTLKDWNKNEVALKIKAEQHWSQLFR